jgi:enoyl-CoA hydratase
VIERDEVDGVAVVRLAHGAVNALDLDLLRAITRTFEELDRDEHLGIVFTGAGRAFSAGVNLWHIAEGEPSYLEAFLPALVTAFETVFNTGKPVVAAVNGHAIAGGCIFAACCDRRIMADAAGRIGVSELLVGVPFPTAALEILGYAVGAQELRRAVFSGGTWEPARALERGLVDEVVPPAHLLERAVRAARQLGTSVPPDTYRLTKQQLQQEVNERIARYWPAHEPEVTRLWRARVRDGGIRSYMEQVTARR